MPILYDSRGVAKKRYGAKTLPRLYVIDKYRIIRKAKKGFANPSKMSPKTRTYFLDYVAAQDEVHEKLGTAINDIFNKHSFNTVLGFLIV